MLIRLLLVILVFGGAFWYFKNIAPQDTKDQIEALISDTTQDIEITTKETKEALLKKKSNLETKLSELQKQVTEKVQQGQDKVEEVRTNIVATKEALDQVEASITKLNESLGLGEPSEQE